MTCADAAGHVTVSSSPSNGSGLLGALATVTTTDPLTAPAGTGTLVMLVSLQNEDVRFATMPLKVTVLRPRGLPNPTPVSVISVPAAAELGVTWASTGECTMKWKSSVGGPCVRARK